MLPDFRDKAHQWSHSRKSLFFFFLNKNFKKKFLLPKPSCYTTNRPQLLYNFFLQGWDIIRVVWTINQSCVHQSQDGLSLPDINDDVHFSLLLTNVLVAISFSRIGNFHLHKKICSHRYPFFLMIFFFLMASKNSSAVSCQQKLFLLLSWLFFLLSLQNNLLKNSFSLLYTSAQTPEYPN